MEKERREWEIWMGEERIFCQGLWPPLCRIKGVCFLRFLLHSNGGLGSSSRRSCIIRSPFSRSPFLVARTSPHSPIRRHENQRQSYRRSHTHLLRCLHDLDPRCQSPHHNRLIYGAK
ncbi:uncharacterized protein LOC9304694 [Arabidopsis lyrata subsp. lyrata]|uniref:uncharacterized protein LOC9304694 n=1 Tax=Arabidopsis lyrata subsp. lyrata TaxID=81972 RepID=UPI000A29B4B6|nr:uncharacterized protein LOC9304694 [Arabidopsis lyrata subsp. lyrata]|eukprot:XP_002870662.2 uncharacterized protein LOC9304694 [Arabidopsis lyrata subsp. lyrata]